MQFSQRMIERIYYGGKTHDCRPHVGGDEAVLDAGHLQHIQEVRGANGKLKWRLGETYAVAPGGHRPAVYVDRLGLVFPDEHMVGGGWSLWDEASRAADRGRESSPHTYLRKMGYKPLRIQIARIRLMRLHELSIEDIRAEGWYEEVRREPMEWWAWVWSFRYDRNMRLRWHRNPWIWAFNFKVINGVKDV